jgi:hypothetical protein
VDAVATADLDTKNGARPKGREFARGLFMVILAVSHLCGQNVGKLSCDRLDGMAWRSY